MTGKRCEVEELRDALLMAIGWAVMNGIDMDSAPWTAIQNAVRKANRLLESTP